MDDKRENSDNYDLLYKVVLIGDSGVGKTALVKRFVYNTFELDIKSTIGVEFATRTIDIDGKVARAQIWDTAGQERFRAITAAYYRGAYGAILAFDITREETFSNLHKWLEEVRLHGDSNIVVMLVGTKLDLKHLRTVSVEDATRYAERERMIYMETSAMDAANVEGAFFELVKQIHERSKLPSLGTINEAGRNGNARNSGGNIQLTAQTSVIGGGSGKQKKKSKKCC